MFEFHQFSVFFIDEKVWNNKFYVAKTEIYWSWFLLYLLICRADVFPHSFAAVYSLYWTLVFIACGVILVTSAPQICSFQDGSVFIKWSFEALRCSFSLLNLLSKGYLNAWRFHFQSDLKNMVNYFSSSSKCSYMLKSWTVVI